VKSVGTTLNKWLKNRGNFLNNAMTSMNLNSFIAFLSIKV